MRHSYVCTRAISKRAFLSLTAERERERERERGRERKRKIDSSSSLAVRRAVLLKDTNFFNYIGTCCSASFNPLKCREHKRSGIKKIVY